MSKEWGYVYEAVTPSFIRRGWRKIGVTTNIKRRLKQLSSSSGQPETFISLNTYRFENIEHAKKVEKYAHLELTKLGLRVNAGREFFAYPSNFFIRDLIFEASEELYIPCLSNGQLERSNSNLGIFMPCRYFLLNDESVFENYIYWISEMFDAMSEISILNSGKNLFDSPIFQILQKPDYPLTDYFRDFDKTPFILAKMQAQYYPHSQFVNELKAIFEDRVSNDLEEYFLYNKNWRENLGKLKEVIY